MYRRPSEYAENIYSRTSTQTTPQVNLVNLEAVGKAYGTRVLLDGVSLGVDDGELDRILGETYEYVERCFRPAMRIGYASRFKG